ncbi:hypothetical protein GT348_04540 [Aristophania vespae]|uniref:Uncharacterized protein n=1 Tax=Aristophania vespae TaxID=2697033 RepID=A0A6P1NGH5_9PROT|nr:hypothetical protein [Aristophania vespae]QHI95630.1 hypothetical protein GT348_04540 [Aristophania vespae]UMM63303.1 hypothetical protein DM15PD_02610 [Aristophania vespae]
MTIDTRYIGRKCERAVITAYQELKDMGQDDMQAFTACTTLYRIYHPESSLPEARLLVSEWIDHHLVKRSHGHTRGCNC